MTKGTGENSLASILWPFWLVAFFFLLAWLLPLPWLWGINYTRNVGPIHTTILLIFVVACLTPTGATASSRLFDFFVQIQIPRTDFSFRLAIALLISGLLFALFWIFRSRAVAYGDQLSLVAELSSGESSSLQGQLYLQPLGILMLNSTSSLLKSIAGLSTETTVALTNNVGGVICFWGLWATARCLTPDRVRQTLLLLAGLSSGAVILFFGYVENYTWPTAGAVWTLCCALRLNEGKRFLWLGLGCGLISLAMHMITLPFILAFVLGILVHRDFNKKREKRWLRALPLSTVFLSLSAVAVWQLWGNYAVFVRLWPVPDWPYWFLSASHLSDYLNLLLQLAPIGLILWLITIGTGKRDCFEDPNIAYREHLLKITVVLTALSAFWIDPLIGMPRDWDLLSLVGFPLSLYGAFRWLSTKHVSSQPQKYVIAPMLAMIALNVVPNLYEKNHAEISLTRLDALLWQDPHYSPEYDKAYRNISWGYMLLIDFGRPELSEKYFRRRLAVDSTSANCWSYLGELYTGFNQMDSALKFFGRAAYYHNSNQYYWARLAETEVKLQKYHQAIQHVNYSLTIDSLQPHSNYLAGYAYLCVNDVSTGVKYLERTLHFNADHQPALIALGTVYLMQHQYPLAQEYLSKAFQLNPSDSKVLEKLITCEISMNDLSSANGHLMQLKQIAPNSQLIPEFKRRLQ